MSFLGSGEPEGSRETRFPRAEPERDLRRELDRARRVCLEALDVDLNMPPSGSPQRTDPPQLGAACGRLGPLPLNWLNSGARLSRHGLSGVAAVKFVTGLPHTTHVHRWKDASAAVWRLTYAALRLRKAK